MGSSGSVQLPEFSILPTLWYRKNTKYCMLYHYKGLSALLLCVDCGALARFPNQFLTDIQDSQLGSCQGSTFIRPVQVIALVVLDMFFMQILQTKGLFKGSNVLGVLSPLALSTEQTLPKDVG